MTEIIINGKKFNNYEEALNAFDILRGQSITTEKIREIDLMVKRPNSKKYELFHFEEDDQETLFNSIYYDVFYCSDYSFYLPTEEDAEKLTLLTFSEWKGLDDEDYYNLSLDMNFEPIVKYVRFSGELLPVETAKKRLQNCIEFFDEIEKTEY